MKRLLKIAGCMLLYLIAFDVAGVVLCFLLDILSDQNTIEYYAIWFVMGVLCGIFSYNTNGSIASPKFDPTVPHPDWKNADWSSGEDSAKTGLLVLVITALVLAALAIPLYLFHWGQGSEPSGYVPDNGPLTLTFFATVLASAIFAHKSFRPQPVQKQTA